MRREPPDGPHVSMTQGDRQCVRGIGLHVHGHRDEHRARPAAGGDRAGAAPAAATQEPAPAAQEPQQGPPALDVVEPAGRGDGRCLHR